MKIKSSLILIAILLAIMLTWTGSMATETTGKSRIVFALDRSGSMVITDPEEVRYEAVRLFVDALSFDGDEAGLVSFDEHGLVELPVTSMDTTQSRDDFKRSFSTTVEAAADTDITEGLAAALDAITADGRHKNYSTSIILLTDGQNDLGPDNQKSEADLEAMLETFLQDAGSENISVFAIGLDAGGQVNEQYLRRITDATGGSTYIIDNAKELTSTVQEIFASEKDTKIETQAVQSAGLAKALTVEVPDERIIETNINLISDATLTIHVYAPDGSDITDDQGKVRIARSRLYTAIKLINPQKGSWRLSVESDREFELEANTIQTYSLNLLPIELADTMTPNTKNQVVFAFFSGEERVNDDYYYKGAGADLVIQDLQGKELSRHTMHRGVGSFYLEFLPAELFGSEGTYLVLCEASSDNINVTAGPYQVEVASESAVEATSSYTVAIGELAESIKNKEPLQIDAVATMDGAVYKGNDIQVQAVLAKEDVKAVETQLQIGVAGYFGAMDLKGVESGAYTLTVSVLKDGKVMAEARKDMVIEGRDKDFYIILILVIVVIATAFVIVFELFGRKNQMLNN